ncbi:hypothetical protein OXX79_009807 [Metschnikowia pulcherrima]
MSSVEKKKITRSRLGCHRCKRLKVKCSEEKPACTTCVKAGEKCDYSLKLTWGGRPYKNTQKQANSARNGNGLVSAGFNASLMTRGSSSVSTSVGSMMEFVSNDFGPSTPSATPMNAANSTNSMSKLRLMNAHATSTSQGSEKGSDLDPRALSATTQHENWATASGIGHISVHSNTLSDVRSIKSEPENHMQKSEALSVDMAPGPDLLRYADPTITHLDPGKVSTPDFFATPQAAPNIDTPRSENVFSGQNIDFSDSFSADLARIERAFPSEQRSPFFNAILGPSPPRKDSLDAEELELELASVLDNSPQKTGSLIRKRNELWQSALTQHSIPPSIVPLPEILLKVPYYRQLLHFWINVPAENLVPAPYLYKDNPFKKILPQMAMHYPGLLTTILAFAARARDDLEGSVGTHSKIIDQLLGRSCDELLKQLQDESEQTSDGTFATSLLLSCYEVCHSNDFNKHRAHNTGASQIMLARTRKSRLSGDSPITPNDDARSSSSTSSLSKRNESDIAYFLSRWFMYVDVIGALSSTRDRGKYLRAYRNHDSYTPVETIPHLDTSGRDIDFLLGFDPELLPHFVNISLLIDEVEKYTAMPENDPSCLPLYITTAALELKDKFYRSYEAGEAKRSMMFDEMIEKNGKISHGRSKDLMTKDNILRSTNKLYYDTGLLNLYRRVLLLPRSSMLVQDLITEMTEIFEYYIEPGSPAQICTIFGLFCAGCDNLNDEKKEFYCERFQGLARQENMNAAKSLVIMNRCWDTGEDWITAANRLDIDLVLM